jgi:hypothetical protein
MVLIPLNSSAIRAAAHDGQNLYIQFHSREEPYTYPNVPDSIFMGLISADSPGTYYHIYIHGKYN